MIKLVVSDIDGTLLQRGSKSVSPTVIKNIRELTEQGVIFCAASGREYSNLYRLFKGVQDDIMYICQNGALIIKGGKVLCRTQMDRNIVRQILQDIGKREGCEILVSGQNSCYVSPKKLSYLEHLLYYVGNDVTITGNLYDIPDSYLKISAYNPDGIGKDAIYFTHRWAKRMPAVVSGACWFDFTAPYVNKGNALAVVQKLYSIDAEDTLVMGDSYNDLEMFDRAYFSYAMSGADSEIKDRARYIADDVESVLFDVLHMR